MKLFVAGCGRSGSTLLRDLMESFEGMFVYKDSEVPVGYFAELSPGTAHVLIKRTASCFAKLPRLPADVGLIYCIRHPFDTLTSSHNQTRHLRPFHITPERWSGEYKAYRVLCREQPERRIALVRYEDLVTTPDLVQQQIAETFHLVPAQRFSESDRGRNIRTSSLRKWEREPNFREYLFGLPEEFKTELARFCRTFGYEIPKGFRERAVPQAVA